VSSLRVNATAIRRRGVAAISAVVLIAGISTLSGVVSAGADITVGTNPTDIAIDTATNIAYVANAGNNTVSVVTGTSNFAHPTISLGHSPMAICVNSTTNVIYTANGSSGTVSVINGATNTLTTTISVSGTVTDVVVDPATNVIYTLSNIGPSNPNTGLISVIDGTTNTVTTTLAIAGVPSSAHGLAVNPTTNLVYASYNTGIGNALTYHIEVINGATNTVTTTFTTADFNSLLTVNPVTNMLFAGTASGTSVVGYDGTTNSLAVTMSTPYGLSSLAIDTSNNTVYCLSGAGTLAVLHPATPTYSTVDQLASGSNASAVAVNPTTHQVMVTNTLLYQNATNTTGTVTIIDGTISSGTPTIATGFSPGRMAINSTTNMAYVINNDGSVSVLNLSTHALVSTFSEAISVLDVAVDAATNTVYLVGGSSDLFVVNGANNSLLAHVNVNSYPGGVAVNPTTNTVYVTNYVAKTLTVLSGATNTITATINVGKTAGAVAVNAATNTVYVANGGDGTMSVINGATNAVTATVSVGPSPGGIAVNATTNMVYVSNSGSSQNLTVVDGATNVVAANVTVGFNPKSVAVDPSTNTVFVGSNGGITSVDGATNTAKQTGALPGTIGCLVFNPTTNTLDATTDGGNGQQRGTGTSGVSLLSVPTAPSVASVTRGNASVTVNIAPPSSSGGAPIAQYTVTATDTTTPANGGQVVSGAASPITVTGLTNGDSYTFTVTVTTLMGTSPSSSASSAAVPATVPGAPTGVSATRGNAQAAVSFTAPASNGGAAITSYTVTANDLSNNFGGGETASGATSPITVTGLIDGDSYTFTVVATNAVGKGAASSASPPVTPATVPIAPYNLSVTAGNASATVSFTSPSTALDGGEPITSFTATATDLTNAARGGQTATGASSPLTVTGLTNGDTYSFTVVATNEVGDSAPSHNTYGVVPSVPATVPGAPTNVTVSAEDKAAAVYFTAPTSDGGATITSYKVTATDSTTPANGGQIGTDGGSPVVVSGLTPGDHYTFTVKAVNSVGAGPASSASAAFVAITLAGAPTAVTATRGDQSATVSFTPPASNGFSAITGYWVTATDSTTPANGGQKVLVSSSPTTITGLTDGDSYTFTVAALNYVGTGPASAASAAVVPLGVASPPTNVVATGGFTSATVTWTSGYNHGSPITSFTVTASGTGGPTCTYTVGVSPGTDTCTVTGLTHQSYTFTVVANNGVGASAASVASNAVTPTTLPGVPTGLSATPGFAQATVKWSAPASDGGSPVTLYTATATPGGKKCVFTVGVSVGTNLCTVYGLTNGTKYTFKVTTTTALGTSAASAATTSVTPLSTDAVITSSATIVVSPSAKVNFALTATGTTPTKTSAAWFSTLGLPSFLKKTAFKGTVANTGTLTGTAPATPGVYTFDVIAADGPGNITYQLVTFTVLGFTSSTTSSAFSVGTAGTITFTTNDPHATLSTKSVLPAGVKLTNNKNGTATLSGTPTKSSATPFTIVITATDGAATTTFTFTLSVS